MSPTTRSTGAEIPLPPMSLRLMGDSDEQFTSHGVALAELLYRLGLRDEDELLDVGCNVGRLAVGLLAGTDFSGRYVGFDIMRPQIRWARRHLTPVAPAMRFRHVNVRNERYNPGGDVEASALRFPVRDDGFDVAALFSVFTHMFKEDVEVYLRELGRVVRPGGRVVASFFLLAPDREEAALASDFPMQHRLDEVTVYSEPDNPLRAIAFHQDYVESMVGRTPLEIETVEIGTWAGGPGPHFQDLVILRRPVPPVPPLWRRAGPGVVRRLRRLTGR